VFAVSVLNILPSAHTPALTADHKIWKASGMCYGTLRNVCDDLNRWYMTTDVD
jgi:hypothetical protein